MRVCIRYTQRCSSSLRARTTASRRRSASSRQVRASLCFYPVATLLLTPTTGGFRSFPAGPQGGPHGHQQPQQSPMFAGARPGGFPGVQGPPSGSGPSSSNGPPSANGLRPGPAAPQGFRPGQFGHGAYLPLDMDLSTERVDDWGGSLISSAFDRAACADGTPAAGSPVVLRDGAAAPSEPVPAARCVGRVATAVL